MDTNPGRIDKYELQERLRQGGMTVQSSPPPSVEKRRGRRLLIALIALLLLALVGSSLGAYFTFFSKGSSPTAPPIVGHAYFASSLLLSPDSTQGIADQLQINLQNIPSPQPGKAYYAWLLNDKNMNWRPIFLGRLTADNSLFYSGDDSDLLATNSRFLITEEDAALPPINPSLDPGTWRYYAEFSQILHPLGRFRFSLYDHIRHLLVEDPTVKKVAGLTGGLDIWLYRNTQKILEWAGSARDLWKYKNAGNAAFIDRQLTRIMDYLDGANYVQKDLPGKSIDPTAKFAQVGLLTPDPNQEPPGYLVHIGIHLREITVLPETAAEQRVLAIQINRAINRVDYLLRAIRDDVLKLYSMKDPQLFGQDGLTLLDSVATMANEAFVGQVDPHGQVTDGVAQIHYKIQRLATFDIRACTASDPCALER